MRSDTAPEGAQAVMPRVPPRLISHIEPNFPLPSSAHASNPGINPSPHLTHRRQMIEIAASLHSFDFSSYFSPDMHNSTLTMTTTVRPRNHTRGMMAHDEDFEQKKHASLVRYNTVKAVPTFLLPSAPCSTPLPPQRAKIIVGFPGVGKSFVSKDQPAQYSWLNIYDEPGYAKGAEDSFFAGVLILAQQPGVLLLPAHRMVGNFLVEHGLVFTSVFPRRSSKEEYLRRYRERGSSEAFVELVGQRWDLFVDNMLYDRRCNHVELEEGQYLKDVFLRILLQADAT